MKQKELIVPTFVMLLHAVDAFSSFQDFFDFSLYRSLRSMTRFEQLELEDLIAKTSVCDKIPENTIHDKLIFFDCDINF